MASGSQQGVLIAQISEQGSSLQQVTPAAAAPSPPPPAPAAAAYNNDPVGAFFPQTTSTEKLSVIRRKRKRHPTAYQEFPVSIMFTFTKYFKHLLLIIVVVHRPNKQTFKVSVHSHLIIHY